MRKFLVFLVLALLVSFSVYSSGTEKQLTFGVVMRDSSPSFAHVLIAGMEKQAKDLGVKLMINDSHNDSLKQLEFIDNFIAMKVDGFIFGGAVDQYAVIPGIEKLNKANIPIISIDSAPTGGHDLLFVGFSHYEIGHKVGEALIRAFKEKQGKVPAGTLIACVGNLRDDVYKLYIAAFHEVIDKYPQLKLVEGEGKWNADEAYRVTTDLVTRWRDSMVGVLVMYDNMTPGVIPALEKAGIDTKKMVIVQGDATGEGLPFMRAGKIDAAVPTVMYSPAKASIQLLYDYVKTGKPMPKPGATLKMYGVDYRVEADPKGVQPFMYAKILTYPWEVQVDDPLLVGNQSIKLEATGSIE